MIPNDADLEMLALVEAAAFVEARVCPVCEEMLDPLDPRWDDHTIRIHRDGELVTVRLGDEHDARARYAATLGPSTIVEGFHDQCVDDDPDPDSDPPAYDPDSIARYGDSDIPPAWLDEAYAGERWDDD